MEVIERIIQLVIFQVIYNVVICLLREEYGVQDRVWKELKVAIIDLKVVVL